MKRAMIIVAIAFAAVSAHAQAAQVTAYNQRTLQLLGLNQDEIDAVLEIQAEAAADIRRHQAEQGIRKAELARLLLEEEPNMRLVERNLRATADIEVDIRLAEIQREVEIRKILGTDRWARIMQAVRQRRDQALEQASEFAETGIAEMQRMLSETQQEIARLMREGRSAANDEEIRNKFRELQNQYSELQELIRERFQ